MKINNNNLKQKALTACIFIYMKNYIDNSLFKYLYSFPSYVILIIKNPLSIYIV